MILVLLPTMLQASPQSADRAAAPSDLQFSFKLDPRLTRSDQMGDRWLSPKTYRGTVGQDTVEVKVVGIDAQGRPVRVDPEWVPSDSEMVMVSPNRGNAVSIVVKRAGESKVQLTAEGVSKELAIKAVYRDNALRVEITQPDIKPVPKTEDVAAISKAQESSAFKSQRERRSYALGVQVGDTMRRQGVDMDDDLYSQGVKDALSGGKMLMSNEEISSTLRDLREELKKEQIVSRTEKRQEFAERNRKEGQSFLTENKAKEGVVTLPSGLQYKIIKPGDGDKPRVNDTVVCNYRGTLLDGLEFDSSYKRGRPATVTVARVIRGWREALQLMPAGSKWQLFVPPELGYGKRGAGKLIGPNATLIFELELLAIKSRGTDAQALHNDIVSDVDRELGLRTGAKK